MANKTEAIYKTTGRIEVIQSLMRDYGVHESCGIAISNQFKKARKEIDKLYDMLDVEGSKMKLNPKAVVRPNISGYKYI